MTANASSSRLLAGLSPEQRARLTVELARRKAAAKPNAIPALPRPEAGPDGAAPEWSFAASPGQERLWYLHQLEPDSTAYVLPIVLRLRGVVDVGVLEGALGLVVERHEVLRT
ncbi:hypothetical protein DY218_18490, partial [Streptomyces triticagri]